MDGLLSRYKYLRSQVDETSVRGGLHDRLDDSCWFDSHQRYGRVVLKSGLPFVVHKRYNYRSIPEGLTSL